LGLIDLNTRPAANGRAGAAHREMDVNIDDATDTNTDTANIHLAMLGEMRVFPVTIRLGERTPLDLLPAARELTMQAAAVAVEQARAKGREISCRAGCGACCRQLVAISVVEAQALADLVAALPPARQETIRRRFSDALCRLEAAGMLDANAPKGQRALLAAGEGERRAILRELGSRYFAQGIACPFLENESCSIHPDRPLVCREYHVTSSAQHCATPDDAKVDSVQPPLHVVDALARAAGRIAGTKTWTIPLVLSIEWAEANGGPLQQHHDGMEMFRALIREIDDEHERPFDARGGMSAG
jgi:Fe-S-cluster containining protein